MPSTRPGLVLVGLVVLSGLAAPNPVAAGDAVPSQGCFPRVDEVERGEAVGDVLAVEILHCFSGSVTVEGPGYEGTVRLVSDDYSGGVTIHIDSRKSGAGALSATAETFPDAALSADTSGDGEFTDGTYEISVRDGSGDVVDRTNVTLSEPTAEDELVAVDTERYRVESPVTTPSETPTATARMATSETRRPGTTSPPRTSTTVPGFRTVGALLSFLAAASLLGRR